MPHGQIAVMFGTSMGVGEGKFTPQMEHFIEVYGHLVPDKKTNMNALVHNMTRTTLDATAVWDKMYALLDVLPKGWTYKVDDGSVSLLHPRWVPIPQYLVKIGVTENLSNLCSSSDEDFLPKGDTE